MQARIFKPTKSVMQSAESKKKWLLEFVPLRHSKFHEPIMGWISSKDMNTQVKLWFKTQQQAVDFAKRKHFEYEVITSDKTSIIPKNYASNFKLP